MVITEVSTNSELKSFIDFPWQIYSNNSRWVPPLKSQIRRLLDNSRHPFWKSARRILFLAQRDSVIVGRIAGIIDERYNRYASARLASWGFFECENDAEAAVELFGAVERWAVNQGMDTLRGPVNPSINYEVGLLMEGFDENPAIMMPYTPPYYISLVECAGFTKEIDLLSFRLTTPDEISDRVTRLAARIRERANVSIRTWCKKDMQGELKLIKDLFNVVWSDNWGFVPISDEEMKEMGGSLARFIEEDFCFFLYKGDEPIGMAMILPDMNPLLKQLNGRLGITGIFKVWSGRRRIKGLRCALFGIKKEHRKLGLPLVLFEPLKNRILSANKYEYLEMGWTLESNEAVNKYIMELGPTSVKRYRVFRKQIPSAED